MTKTNLFISFRMNNFGMPSPDEPGEQPEPPQPDENTYNPYFQKVVLSHLACERVVIL